VQNGCSRVQGLGYAVIGLLLLTMLLVALISMRREAHGGEPIRGLLWLTVLMLGLCACVALSSAYITARSLQTQPIGKEALPQ
jgi:hypothetical protein